MKPIAVQRSWEKNSRVGRSFWLLSRIGQRFGAFRKGRVKRTEPQRPLSFLGSFSPASKTALGKWSSPNPARIHACAWSVSIHPVGKSDFLVSKGPLHPLTRNECKIRLALAMIKNPDGQTTSLSA